MKWRKAYFVNCLSTWYGIYYLTREGTIMYYLHAPCLGDCSCLAYEPFSEPTPITLSPRSHNHPPPETAGQSCLQAPESAAFSRQSPSFGSGCGYDSAKTSPPVSESFLPRSTDLGPQLTRWVFSPCASMA